MNGSKARDGNSSQGSQRDKTVTLPKINQVNESKLTTNTGELVDNPFYVPDDYEQIFKLKEKEKELKKQDRAKNQNLRIWEKGIKQKGQYTVGKLKDMCKIDEEQDEETLAKLNIVDAANSAIKNRVRQKEPMHQFIDKKREMLLFQMLIDHKREMINQFEELTRCHRRGLDKSEQLLEEDLELFNKFLDDNKTNSRDAIKKAEAETRLKQERANEIKTLYEHKADLMTKNAQKIENLDDLLKYKKFLDDITPKEFIAKLDQKKKGKGSKDKLKSDPKDGKMKSFIESYNLNIGEDVIALLEDSDEEFDMYFKSPNQLEEHFQGLEERNLFLIANTKDVEQNVEERRHGFEKLKRLLEERLKNASHTKTELTKTIENMDQRIKVLKQIKNDNEAQEQLSQLRQQIDKVYKNVVAPERSETKKDISSIEMLKEMETKLDQYIRELKQYRAQAPEMVSAKERDCIADKREMLKLSKQEQDSKEQQEKQKQQQQQPQKEKRMGRPVMVRSWPPQEEKEVEVIQEIPEEEIERRMYFT